MVGEFGDFALKASLLVAKYHTSRRLELRRAPASRTGM